MAAPKLHSHLRIVSQDVALSPVVVDLAETWRCECGDIVDRSDEPEHRASCPRCGHDGCPYAGCMCGPEAA